MPRLCFIRESILRRPQLFTSLMLLALAAGTDAHAHGVTLHLQHTQPATSTVSTKFIEPWTNKVHDDAGGRITLHIEPLAAKDTDLFQLVVERQADVVWMDLTNAAEAFPRLGVFAVSLPGNTSEGSSRAVWTQVEMNDLGFREFKEMRIVAVSRRGPPLFHLRDKQPASLADLQGLKIGVPGSDGESFLKALGVSVIAMSYADMGKALENSSIDGVMLSWNSLEAYALDKFVKHHVNAPDNAVWAYAELSALLMNPNAYRAMTDDLKQVIRANSGMDASAWLGKVFDEDAAQARERAAARGAHIATLPDAELGTWEKAAEAAIAKHVEALDARKLKGARMVTSARKLITENDGK